MKKLLAGSGIVAGILALGLSLGYWHFSGLMPEGDGERAPAGQARSQAPVAAAPDGPFAPSPAPSASEPDAPAAAQAPAAPVEEAATFTLLRVEPDGSALLAGRAEPGGEVVIRSGDAVLAREDVTPGGDFVVTLDEPLAVGDHELTLEAIDADGRSTVSPEVAIVSVPDPERPEELLVAVGAPQAPTRLLAVPAPAEPAAPAAQAGDAADGDEAGTGPVLAPLRGSTGETGPMEAQAGAPAPEGDLAIAAVEIEDERIFVAGSSRPGATIRIYLDGEFIAEANEAGERFIAEAIGEVPVGSHVVRADEVGPDGTVVARVEVPFERPEGGRMAALARGFGTPPGPAAEPATQAAPADGAPPAVSREPAPVESAAPLEPATQATQAALEPVEGRVIIRRGDTLWRISRETYGQGSRYTTIYLANGDQIRDPDLIYPGQIFRMPAEEERATN